MSRQERVSWISLIVNLLIGYWYFERVLSLPADADLLGPRMAAFAVQLIILSIFIGIACEIALRMVQKGADSDPDKSRIDERDVQINLKASRNAYGVLSTAIFLVLVLVALIEWAQRYPWAWFQNRPNPQTVLGLMGTGPLAAMHVAQLLLLALTIGAITVYVSRIFYYRRGY